MADSQITVKEFDNDAPAVAVATLYQDILNLIEVSNNTSDIENKACLRSLIKKELALLYKKLEIELITTDFALKEYRQAAKARATKASLTVIAKDK